MTSKPKKIIICGATATGKSAMAIAIAQKTGAVIINADSQQVYREIPILSAQPTVLEQEIVLHELFGTISGAENFSVAKWLELASVHHDRPEIFVGGTGLYINALLNGLSPIPEIPPEIREKVRAMDIDEVAKTLGSNLLDNQRMRRALEVKLATNKNISEFHGIYNHKFSPDDFTILVVVVSRETLYQRINQRFSEMLKNGGIEEVKTLLAMNLDPAMPVMKACGVPQLAAYLRGECTYDEAVTLACQVSRNYAKRQMTWFRNQLPAHKIEVANLADAARLFA